MTIPTTDLLRLTQWLSPAFPVSGYAYSHGLEAAMAAGPVTDAASTGAWVACVLRRGAGALDAWAIRAVLGGADPAEIAGILRARAGSAERSEEMEAMGAAFCRTTAEMGGAPLPDLPLPVALAIRAAGMDARVVATLYLQAFAAQLVGAATRFLPLGQAAAQAVLANLHPVIDAVAARSDPAPPGGGALLAELDAMAHERLQPRIFRT
ncbi:MAG: urease accessory UreF family protein [Pseudomonadota bacterium]